MKSLRFANRLLRGGDYSAALENYSEIASGSRYPRILTDINIELCKRRIRARGEDGSSFRGAPLVSVIVPAHNVKAYIGKCLSSLRAQLLRHIEIIVVDDGSTDGTADVVDEHRAEDSRIVLIRNSCASGNSGTPRNQGLRYCTGDYIAFVDADDWIDSDMLSSLYAVGIANDSDIVSCNGFFREKNDGSVETVKTINNGFHQGDDAAKKKMFLSGHFPIVWFRIYKRKLIVEKHIRFGTTTTSADLPFAFKALYWASSVDVVDGVFYHYRFDRPGSTIDRRRGRGAFQLFIAYEGILKFLERQGAIKEFLPYLALKLLGDYAYNMRFLSADLKDEFSARMSQIVRDLGPDVGDSNVIPPKSKALLQGFQSGSPMPERERARNIKESSSAKPSVSIIVPIHNVSTYLPQCINSLISQTLRDIEIILVNDGSEDDSGKILTGFAKSDSRIRIIDVSKASGYAATPRNMGLEAAQGKYIGFVDGDDWVEPSMYADLVLAASENGADIASCSHFMKHELDARQIVRIGYREIRKNGGDGCEALQSGCFSTVWNRIYSAELISNHGIYFPLTRVSEDLAFSIATHVFANRTIEVEGVGYNYRFNRPESTSDLRRGAWALKTFESIPTLTSYLQSFAIPNRFDKYINKLRLGSILYTLDRIDGAIRGKYLAKLRRYENELLLGFDPAIWSESELKRFSKLGFQVGGLI